MLLMAAALATSRIKLGTPVTPVARSSSRARWPPWTPSVEAEWSRCGPRRADRGRARQLRRDDRSVVLG